MKWSATAASWFVIFLLKALVRRVNLRSLHPHRQVLPLDV